jgi:cell division protein FtsB
VSVSKGGGRSARAQGSGRGTGRRLLAAAGIVAALVFAVQGGEYSTLDLLRQRNREARLRAEIDSLARVVDSLTRYRRRLETDPVLQEQIAREEFGMVRGEREILYRFAEPAEGR